MCSLPNQKVLKRWKMINRPWLAQKNIFTKIESFCKSPGHKSSLGKVPFEDFPPIASHEHAVKLELALLPTTLSLRSH